MRDIKEEKRSASRRWERSGMKVRRAGLGAGRFGMEEKMKSYYLRENRPAEKFADAHFLGNGSLGLSVTGGAPQETIHINDDTLWSGSESFRANPQHYEKMQEARRLTLAGRVKEANDIVNNEMEGRWFETYLPLAELHLTFGQRDDRRIMPLKTVLEPADGEIGAYERRLDLGQALETVEWERDGICCREEIFVSHPAQAAFIRCSAKRRGQKEENGEAGGPLQLAFDLESRLHAQNGTDGGEAWLAGIAPDHAEPEYTPATPRLIWKSPEESKALRFACAARAVSCDGKVWSDGSRVYVNDASFVLIAVAAGTGYRGFEAPRDSDEKKVLAELDGRLDRLEGEKKDYLQLKKEHLEDYQSLYDRLDIDLGPELSGSLPLSERLACCAKGVDDPSLAALYLQYSRYLTIAASRPGSQAMNLQGIWNDKVMPPWSSNYTNNINVEMNYWPCETLALPECHLPLMDLLLELSEAGKKTAREYYHSDGWVVHHNTDLWRSTEPSCEDASWSWWPMGGAWLCQHIWTHYRYTGDLEFLKKMYPVMREASVFFLGFLTENQEGYLVTAPSISPENKFLIGTQEETERMAGELVEKMASADRCSPNHPKISAVTMASTMDMSLLRELFSNTAEAAALLGRSDDPLPEMLGAALKRFPPYRTGKYGQLLEWYEDYEECTPGMGHISHLYPAYPGEIITQEKTPGLFEAARRSLERRLLHSAENGSWPASWKICLMARFHDSLECGHLLKSAGSVLGAGLLVASHQQIDAIFGLGAGIAEMLLQSHQSFLELLPAIPVDWNRGSVRGLRARGGFEVCVSWDKGWIRQAEISSRRGGVCRVKARGLKGVRGAAGVWDGDVLSFDTQAGAAYSLLFAENELAGLEIRI